MGSRDAETYDARYVERLEAEAEGLRRQNRELLDSYRALQEEMTGSILALKGEVDRLTEELRLARGRQFGQKSEKAPADQMRLSIFDEVEAEASAEAPEPALERGPVPEAPGRRRRGGRRRIDMSKLERRVIDHVVGDPRCPSCGRGMEEMKVEVREVVRLVPAHLVVEEHRTHVYRCPECCRRNAEGQDVKAQIVRAEHGALTPLPHSFATASLIASVINAKYVVATPLHRIESEFRGQGIEVSRQDMANWVIGCKSQYKVVRLHHFFSPSAPQP